MCGGLDAEGVTLGNKVRFEVMENARESEDDPDGVRELEFELTESEGVGT